MKEINNRGLTLVEIIISLAILSILLGMTIPKIKDNDLKLRAEARQLCNEIRLLRLRNMTENQQLNIVIYRDYYEILDNNDLLERKNLEEGIAIFDNLEDNSGSNSKLKFNHNGAPNFAGTITVQNKNTGKYMEITVIPVTGRVLLYNEIFSP